MRAFRFLRWITAFCLAGTLLGQTVGEEALSLDQCVRLALDRHPLIQAATNRHEAAVARIRQATAFPIPSIDYNSDLQPHFGDFVNSEESYLGVSQTLELPRKRAARGKIAEQESREVETDIELVRLEVVFQVRRSFYDLLLAQEKMSYAKQDLELAQNYLEMAEVKLAAGDVGRVEVLRARVEALRATNTVKVAMNDVNLAKVLLNYDLARGANAPIEIKGQLQLAFNGFGLEDLRTEALKLRPELRRLRLSLERETLVQQNSRLASLPDLDLNVSRHRLAGEASTWSFTVSAPLPFLFQQRQKAEIAESQANSRALTREFEQVRNAISMDVEEAYANAVKARDQILLHQSEILPQAQEVLEMFTFSYREGEISGIELMEARRTLNESRRSYADALYEYAVASAAIDKAVGRQP